MLLSSQTVVRKHVLMESSNPTLVATELTQLQKGMRSIVAIESVLYSASIVERAMSVCNLLDQIAGQQDTQITNPV